MKKIIVAKSIVASAHIGFPVEKDFTSGAPAVSSAITKTVKNPVENNIPHPDVNPFAKALPLLKSERSIPQQQIIANKAA